MHSIGRDTAIKLAGSGWWVDKTAREICQVQLFTEELCLPFEVFHRAIGEALGRSVYTHEMAGKAAWQRLVDEFLGEREAPTLADILGMFPPDVQVVAVVR
jgi:hypothetical protein